MNRLRTLEEARALSIAGEYAEALALLELLLQKDPRDLDALRLKGNVIELRVLHAESGQGVKHTYSPEIGRARTCYEQILLIKPQHPGALVDLGTHWNNVGDDEKALRYFDEVLSVCHSEQGEWRDALVEAIEGKIEILERRREVAVVQMLKERLSKLRTHQ